MKRVGFGCGLLDDDDGDDGACPIPAGPLADFYVANHGNMCVMSHEWLKLRFKILFNEFAGKIESGRFFFGFPCWNKKPISVTKEKSEV